MLFVHRNAPNPVDNFEDNLRVKCALFTLAPPSVTQITRSNSYLYIFFNRLYECIRA